MATPAATKRPRAKRKAPGRPSLTDTFTPDKQKKVLDAVRAGASMRAAAGQGGIAESTLRAVVGGDKRYVADFIEFIAAFELAESDCETAMAAVIAKAARGYKKVKTKTVRRPVFVEGKVQEGVFTEEVTTEESLEFDWRAALEWLKRRRREEWGDHINVGGLTDEDLIAEIARLLFGGEEAGSEDTGRPEDEGDSEDP